MPIDPSELPSTWNVTIEAAGDLADPPVDGQAVESLIDLLGDHSPSVSHRQRRYEVGLTVYAHGAHDAVQDGMELWDEARREADLPDWEVVAVAVRRA